MLKKIGLAVAVAAASASANAAWTPNGADGELILNVWNNATQTSFSMDLGVAADAAPLAGESLTFNIGSTVLDYVGGSSADLMWNVAGINSFTQFASVQDVNDFGLYITASSAPVGGASFVQVSGQQAAFANLETFLASDGVELVGGANGTIGISGGNYAGNTAVWGASANTIGGTSWFAANTAASSGDSLYAYKLGSEINTTTGQFSSTYFESAGVWSFDAAAGTLTYGSVAAVPVPAAVWMFASGLVGLAGIARRKKA